MLHAKVSPGISVLLTVINVCFIAGNLCFMAGNTMASYIEPQPVALKDLLGPGQTGLLLVDPANATCGMLGTEPICSVAAPITCIPCDSTNPSRHHPPTFMVDKDTNPPSTFWQSSGWSSYPSPHLITITMSLRKDYRINDDISIIFRDPLPTQMVLEKSRDYGDTWEVLEYYSTNCVDDFGMDVKATSAFTTVTEILCSNPYHDAEIVTNSSIKVTFPLINRLELLSGNDMSDIRNLYEELDTNETLRNYLKLTDLRLRLMRPATIDGAIQPSDSSRHHYGVYDINTLLSCECNLHGDYCSLIVDEVMCHCKHYTTGKSCENCTLGYQLLPWQPASYQPFPDGTANECTAQPGFTTNPPAPPATDPPVPPATDSPAPPATDPPAPPATDPPVPSEMLTTAVPTLLQSTQALTTQDTRTLEGLACEDNPCNGNGLCMLEDTALGFTCQCYLGYSGERCTVYTDPCSFNPCPQSHPQCYSNGGLLYTCYASNVTLPSDRVAPTKIPTGPLSSTTIGIIIGASVAIPAFCIFIVILLWCTTWRHLHPTVKNHTIKYMYDPELNGMDGSNGFTNNGYGLGNGESFLVPDGVSSMRVRHVRDKWMVKEENLEIGKLLYSGQFAYVCEASLKTSQDGEQKVVVKLLRDEKDAESLNELKKEFEVMANLGRHPNILWLMGMCSRTLEDETQTCLIMQYVSRGDMLRILRRCRARRRDQEPFSPLPQEELLSFATDIASGMRHLSILKYVHRNLCAKNILITFNNKAKIGDFGAATDIPVYQDYATYKEPRNKHQIRWLAYEAILEGLCTTNSDVWSFGIVLWEIATLGGMPYPNIKTSDLPSELKSHLRMDWPKHCTTELYDLMLRCWHRRPDSRPSFEVLIQDLKKLKGSGKKHINLKDYTFQMYVPVKLPEDLDDENMNDSFV